MRINHNQYSISLPADRDRFLELLTDYDVISFDLFDTLIRRPFETPQDLFTVVGKQLEITDFKEKRIKAEKDARDKRFRISSGTGPSFAQYILARLRRKLSYDTIAKPMSADSEVTLREIWEELAPGVGISIEEGMKAEIEAEEMRCFADPQMSEIWKELQKEKKRLIVTTDMYLPEDVLCRILNKNGFDGYERLFVSCVYRKSKADGRLFEEIKKAYPGTSIIHAGDDPVSDQVMAERHGLGAVLLRPL